MRFRKSLTIIIALVLIGCLLVTPIISYASPASDENFRNYSYDKTKLNNMLNKYQVSKMKFAYKHSLLDTPKSLTYPRYRLNSKGLYTNPLCDEDNEAVIMFAGDLMCRYDQQDDAFAKHGVYTFNETFDYVKPYLDKADFAVGNLEIVTSESASYMSFQKKIEGKPNDNAPSTFLGAVRYGGFDMVVNANNHICDAGLTGIYQTIGHMNEYGLIHTGVFEDSKETRYTIVDIDGIKVAFLAYATYYNNKNKHLKSAGQKIFLNTYSKSAVTRDVKAAKKAGAEYVFAYIHWGIEYDQKETKTQRNIAKNMANAGVDFIIGSHPHVLQKYDVIKTSKGKSVSVVYSMGNFVSDIKKTTPCKDSIILSVKLGRDAKGKVKLKSKSYIPCTYMKKYAKNINSVIPVTKGKRTTGTLTKRFGDSYKRIKKIMGKKISPYSGF